MVGDEAPLPVGRATEGQVHRRAGQPVRALDRVARGVDVGVRRAHETVHLDRAARAELEPGGGGESALGLHADGKHHQVGDDLPARFQAGDERATLRREGRDGVAQHQLHALGAQRVGHRRGDLRIERRQHLVGRLGQCNRFPDTPHLLGHLQADEASADHQHARGGGGGGLDAIHVPQISQGEDARVVDARQRRTQRRGPGREDQLVVGHLALRRPPAARDGGQIAHHDHLSRPVDARRLRAREHLDVQQPRQTLRRLHRQPRAVRDLAADVVGQTAVRERHVGTALQHGYPRRLAQTPRTRRRRGPGRHAADDDHSQSGHVFCFHNMSICAYT